MTNLDLIKQARWYTKWLRALGKSKPKIILPRGTRLDMLPKRTPPSRVWGYARQHPFKSLLLGGSAASATAGGVHAGKQYVSGEWHPRDTVQKVKDIKDIIQGGPQVVVNAANLSQAAAENRLPAALQEAQNDKTRIHFVEPLLRQLGLGEAYEEAGSKFDTAGTILVDTLRNMKTLGKTHVMPGLVGGGMAALLAGLPLSTLVRDPINPLLRNTKFDDPEAADRRLRRYYAQKQRANALRTALVLGTGVVGGALSPRLWAKFRKTNIT